MQGKLTVPDVLSFGVINLDFVMELSGEIIGEKILGKKISICAGGHGINQAIGVVRSGVSAGLIGKIGKDILSQEVIRMLQQEKIFCGLVEQTDGMSTGISALINAPDDEQKTYDFPGANYSMQGEDIDAYREYIAKCKIVIVRNGISVYRAANRLIKVANEYEKCVILISSRTLQPEDVTRHMPDYLILSAQEASRVCAVDIHNKKVARAAAGLLLQKVKKAVIVQMDDKGVLVANRQSMEILDEDPGYKVQDYAGSLSFFAGVFAAELVKGTELNSAVVKAHRASKICASRIGVYTSFPTAEEIEKL